MLIERSYMGEPKKPQRPEDVGDVSQHPKNKRRGRRVWTIVWTTIFGIFFAVSAIDAVLPHSKNNPLSNDITGTVVFGLLIVA